MFDFVRCRKGAAAMAFLALSVCAPPEGAPEREGIRIVAAGPGSGFLPYAEGLSRHLESHGLVPSVVETSGSIENLLLLEADTETIGLVFLASVYEDLQGRDDRTGGETLPDLCALFPMYETSFQLVSLRGTGIGRISDLAGRRVGVGPSGGPAESFFHGLMAALDLEAVIVNGTPLALVGELLAERIDALWQGASLPIPSIVEVTATTEAVVYGFSPSERDAMLRRFPFMASATIPPGTYRGQDGPVESVAAWNFVMANCEFPEDAAYLITKAVLGTQDPAAAIHSSARSTKIENAVTNTIVPFHPGALRYYREVAHPGS
jgi:uncharacterized protein